MGLFGPPKESKRVLDCLDELRDEVSDLKRARRSLELEFTELYDKVSHQMSRMAKRYERRSKVEELEPEEPVVGEPVIGSDPISQSIMLRRAGRG